MVQYGGVSVRTLPLDWTQHGICLAIGFSLLPVGLLVKIILPVRFFNGLHMKEEPMSEEEATTAFNTTFKQSLRQSLRTSQKRVKAE